MSEPIKGMTTSGLMKVTRRWAFFAQTI